ncbi:hypothetical protein HHK36_029354 [Tetracentron sinense]|uniref:CG-1 domain-containing protein n=1 Tax=Tetracentron sinense TaxID=13715 RepID=A0A834Y9G4_TETSI|nr:hypothetical protein HHK36_029354 [Tetracentron sinense]
MILLSSFVASAEYGTNAAASFVLLQDPQGLKTMQSGFDINELAQEAQNRWLKPAEVLVILQNHENHKLTLEPPQKPPSGSLFLFNKRVLRFFRKDGHSWRKKKDGRTVGEAHERLKGQHNAGTISRLSAGSSSAFSQSPSFYSAQNAGCTSEVNEIYEPCRNSSSPASVEVNSELVIRKNGMDHWDVTDILGEFSSSSEPEVSHALQRLKEQLSLNDDSLEEAFPSFCGQNEKAKDLGVLDYERVISKHDECYEEYAVMQDNSNNSVLLQNAEPLTGLFSAGDYGKHHYQPFGPEYTIERKESPSWKQVLELSRNSTQMDSQEKYFYTSDVNEKPLSSVEWEKIPANPAEKQENWPSQSLDFGGNNAENWSTYHPTSESNLTLQLSAARQFLLGSDNLIVSPTSMSPLQEVENSKISTYSSGLSTHEANPDYYAVWSDQESQFGIPLGVDLSLTIAQKQRFTIREISPEWGYATEDTKVIITGSFLCDPSECTWTCMFGDIEVPLQIIQEGVLSCRAPSHVPGKVTLCITCGNRESCSEVREFEYHTKPRSSAHYNSLHTEVTKSPEELLLLVRFSQMLLCAPSVNSVMELRKLKPDEDSWGHIIDALLVGSGTPSSTMDWLLQELLKDKLQQWLSSRNQKEGDMPGCSMSKKEQGIIHMVSGLGFEWALNPILNSGVNINFRDVNGWTALHWAARFGREKMIAALIAAGASAWAVTDPSSHDRAGKTPASIASTSGHKGLAGYLSEMALTGHLSSLTLEESELSKDAAAMGAEITVSISKESLSATEDQLSLEDSLAAVRNATQAATRIQSAFRAHSFRRRQQIDADAASSDEYGITPGEIHGLSAASKLAFGKFHAHKLDTAALSIQKKYRGWKGRKDYQALRQKVVKIQAHVRGHQVRQKYKVICWAVGVLDKAVLRWRRRGIGLRGFRLESEAINESEDEDFLKVFRKQKVDMAIDEAVSRVLSMVESPEARQQYRRILESYRQAKVNG